MDFSKEGSVRLIELSILGVNEACFEFLTSQEETFKKCFNRSTNISYPLEFSEYYSFALEWILKKKKLLSLYKFLRSNELLYENPEILQNSIGGYFFRIAHSAFIEYWSEVYPGTKVLNKDHNEFLSVPSATRIIPYKKISYEQYIETSNDASNRYDPQKFIESSDDVNSTDIIQFLGTLNPLKRIPFWLTYLCREFPLPENDIKWLSVLNECSTGEIRVKISSAVESNENKSFAVSSMFLGELLQEKPNTLSKRIQRVFDDIKKSTGKC